MKQLVLHHYPNSPFAEKIRLILGYKALHWTSVHSGPEARAALGLYLERLEQMLGNQDFFLGAQPTIADFSIYHCLWFVVRGGPTAQIFEPFRQIEAWRGRMRAFGHGSHDEIDSRDARPHLDRARRSPGRTRDRALSATRIRAAEREIDGPGCRQSPFDEVDRER